MKKLILLSVFLFGSVFAWNAEWHQAGTEYRVDNAIVTDLCDFDGGNCISIAGGGVAGSDTWVQFNDGGAMGAEAAFNYVKGTDTLNVVNITATGTGTIGTSVSGATTITTTDAANALTLGLIQQDTGTSHVLDITNAGTGNAITIDTTEFVVDSVGFVGIGIDPTVPLHLLHNEDGVSANLGIFSRTSASPADDDSFSILLNSENDNDQQTSYGSIKVTSQDVSDGAEDGLVEISTMVNGTLTSMIEFDGGNAKITPNFPIEIGKIEFAEDSGAVTIANMDVSDTPTNGDEESYTFRIDNNNVLKVKGSADGAGGADDFQVVIGETLGSATLPSLAFGDGDSGFYESADNVLELTLAGVRKNWLDFQGTDEASATNIALTADGNAFELTGTTKVDLISNVGWLEGDIITLIANESVTIDDGTATSATNITINLAGGDFGMTADDTLRLMLSSTTAGGQQWRELSRSVN